MARFRALGPALVLCGAVLSVVLTGAAAAQDVDPRISVVDPPRADADLYLDTARNNRLETELLYADRLDPSFLTDQNPEIEPVSRPGRRPAVRLDGGFGVFVAIALVALLLFLWLRFGGSGALLSATPKDSDGATTAPDTWQIDADEAALDGMSLLDRIRAMPDRRQAMVHLLRHALLAAGQQSQTRFARSDTEREAFARLPENWNHREVLRILLRAAELAHYGGRPVSEEAFENALDHGAVILGGRGGPLHG